MHIPDGYLGPATYGTMYAATIPFWAFASWKLNKTLKTKQAPFLALGAAFSFVIMMFNIPIIGGTSGHATGATLIAILLGPWAAIISVSVALIIQALLFGDGGITAIGANCFNMAVVGGLAGYGTYRLIAAGSGIQSRRRWIAGAIAAYLSLNISALITAVQFGIQPLLEKSPAFEQSQLYAKVYALTPSLPRATIPDIAVRSVPVPSIRRSPAGAAWNSRLQRPS